MNITTLLYASVLAAVSVIPIEVADAFVFNRRYTHNSHECLELRMQVDVAGIIKAALSTSNKFGVASYKAIIAWKPIDEIDYDDGISGKAAYKARYDDTLGIEDYETLLDEIKPLLEKQEMKTGKMKSLAKEIKSIKDSRDGSSTNSLRDAIAFARRATKEFGIHSTQSIAAWESFDKIAEDEALHAQSMTEIGCLLEDIEKCLALEEIHRALNMTAV
ncbi:hypothetical protein ACHAXN_006870 [Cyclotella atomus]